MAELKLGNITKTDEKLLTITINNNPYIPEKIKRGVFGYPQQLKSIIYLNRPILNDYHRILIGGEAFGGKTLLGQYRDWETDRKSTRLNSSHSAKSRMPSSA